MRKFNPTAKHPDRALQAWQILIGNAKNRQTITYKELAKPMYKKNAAGVLASVLGHIAFYCIDNELPPLTSLVVHSGKGVPQSGIPIDRATIDEQREKVFGYDWYNIYPPTERELAASYSRHAR